MRLGALQMPWTPDDDRRLRAMILAMFPYGKILAEFPDHRANDIRGAWEKLFYADSITPLERAIHVLDGRAVECRNCSTGLRLDGRPSSAWAIILAANFVLAARGLPRIVYLSGIAR